MTAVVDFAHFVDMSDQLDGLFLNIAQNCPDGIRGMLDAFFGFLSRRTDFYYGAAITDAKELVLEQFEKHKVGLVTIASRSFYRLLL